MSEIQAHAGNQPYDEEFYRKNQLGLQSANIVLPIVEKFVHPKNVIDVGCGSGTWLAAWKKLFGVDVLGIDGDYVDRSQLMVDEKEFYPVNLERGGRLSPLIESSI